MFQALGPYQKKIYIKKILLGFGRVTIFSKTHFLAEKHKSWKFQKVIAAKVNFESFTD